MEQAPRQDVHIAEDGLTLHGTLTLPREAKGIVIFAHGSGSSRLSPRNLMVATYFAEAGLATLLFDLLTAEEEQLDAKTRHLRFDIDLLSERLALATHWVKHREETALLPIGYFGASTGAAAALVASTEMNGDISAIVSRGGRPDLALSVLAYVETPTLLIVGSQDEPVIELNRRAMSVMGRAAVKMEIVRGAHHLFEEEGTLEQVAELARTWFMTHLRPPDETQSAAMGARSTPWLDL